MASNTDIANRALGRVGAKRITALTEDSVAARTVAGVFDQLRQAELRAHRWSFAIKRAQLAAAATGPAFGPSNAFPLPADFLKLIPPDPELHSNDLDWRVEGRSIVTYDTAPLNIRYVYDVTDANLMDPLFREAFAMRLAQAICEPLTQSNTKVQIIARDYDVAVAEARRANAIERPSVEPPEDTWVTARL